MIIYVSYHWRHLPTQHLGVTNFASSDAKYLHKGELKRYGGLTEETALRLVNNWNKAGDWKYWI